MITDPRNSCSNRSQKNLHDCLYLLNEIKYGYNEKKICPLNVKKKDFFPYMLDPS